MKLRTLTRSAFGVAAVAAVAALTAGTSALAGGVEPGAKAPDFTLTDVHGETHRLSDYTKAGKVVVLEWFNPDCPFVKKHHERATTMKNLFNEFKSQNVVWLAVNSNTAGSQGSGLERNRRAEQEYAIDYPILMDETSEIGRAYGATNTPHMYVIGKAGEIVYAGAIDNNRSASTLGDVNYVRQALQQYFAGETVDTPVTKAYGCTVKYPSN